MSRYGYDSDSTTGTCWYEIDATSQFQSPSYFVAEYINGEFIIKEDPIVQKEVKKKKKTHWKNEYKSFLDFEA